ncbi:MAG TPA: GTP-binding protein, partial [Candidatus Paceibacterota bacterium]|nr:GTP-binding protein [Candidatus Paceibacterota bacterium]
FRALRSRGAAAADVAILVVAADEGVKPQTLEALAAIQDAKIPFVIALTKIDKNGADPERAKTSLLENGVYLEGLGGEIPYAPVSSKTGAGVPELLDLVLLTADLAELSADPALPASGFVLESTQDPKRGLLATLIVKNGTLATGSFVVTGSAYAPIRFIENFAGKRVEEAGPSSPARVSGFTELPAAGMPFTAVKTRKEAEALVAEAAKAAATTASLEATEDGIAVLPLVVKADVTGSIEAIKHELAKVTHENAVIRIVSTGVGAVGEADVKTAQAVGGIVIAFTVSTDSAARDLADRSNVPIESFSIIYDLKQRVADLLTERAPKVAKEEVLGEVKVLKVFSATSTKKVLGARHVSGTVSVGDQVRIKPREGEGEGRGKIVNLQQARVDVDSIKVEGEFGMQIETKFEMGGGDTVTAFRMTEAQ